LGEYSAKHRATFAAQKPKYLRDYLDFLNTGRNIEKHALTRKAVVPPLSRRIPYAETSAHRPFLEVHSPAPAGKRRIEWDGAVPGLGVRITDKKREDSGRKALARSVTFVLVARYPGSTNPAPRAIGEYGAISLETARAKARTWIDLLAKGVDPKHEEERQRREEQRRRANSFAAVAEDFIKNKVAGERQGKPVERNIRRAFIPSWGGRPITEITAQDVRAVVKAAKDRGAPYQARALLVIARRLFGWAIDQDSYGLTSSPCDRLKPKALIGVHPAPIAASR
jgi:hypothetical protein